MSYIGVGTTLIATIYVMFYYGNKIAVSIKSIEETRKKTEEYSDMLQESQRETIRILSERVVASKVENATLTEKLKCILRSITVADAYKFSAEERRWYVDNCSEYNVQCLLPVVESALQTLI